jgi:hypothetical protein
MKEFSMKNELMKACGLVQIGKGIGISNILVEERANFPSSPS